MKIASIVLSLACGFAVFALPAATEQLDPLGVSEKGGLGLSRVYIPGSSDESRWSFVKDHMKELCTFNKAQVLKLLGKGLELEQNSQEIWAYRISDEKLGAFDDCYYQLSVVFDSDRVSRLETRHIAKTIGRIKSKP